MSGDGMRKDEMDDRDGLVNEQRDFSLGAFLGEKGSISDMGPDDIEDEIDEDELDESEDSSIDEDDFDDESDEFEDEDFESDDDTFDDDDDGKDFLPSDLDMFDGDMVNAYEDEDFEGDETPDSEN